jgi:hypothetical protein
VEIRKDGGSSRYQIRGGDLLDVTVLQGLGGFPLPMSEVARTMWTSYHELPYRTPEQSSCRASRLLRQKSLPSIGFRLRGLHRKVT